MSVTTSGTIWLEMCTSRQVHVACFWSLHVVHYVQNWMVCACSSRMRSLQRRQSLAWTTDGTMASQYMLSCLLSPTSERLAVGSTRWGEDEGVGCEWRGRWREEFYDRHVPLVFFLCLYNIIHDRSFRECTRGGFCNFMHLKPISRELQWVAFTAPVLCTNAPCVSISLLPSSFSVATSILVRPTTGSSLVVAADHEVHAGTHTSCTYLWACQNSMSISTLHFCPLSGPGLVVAPAHLAEGVRTRSEVNSNTHTVYSNTWRTV